MIFIKPAPSNGQLHFKKRARRVQRQRKNRSPHFYLMIKNHPFQNGNKRIATTTLMVFLFLNKKWIKVDTQELYNFTVWSAQSPAKLKNEVAKAIEKFINTYMIKIDDAQGKKP